MNLLFECDSGVETTIVVEYYSRGQLPALTVLNRPSQFGEHFAVQSNCNCPTFQQNSHFDAEFIGTHVSDDLAQILVCTNDVVKTNSNSYETVSSFSKGATDYFLV